MIFLSLPPLCADDIAGALDTAAAAANAPAVGIAANDTADAMRHRYGLSPSGAILRRALIFFLRF